MSYKVPNKPNQYAKYFYPNHVYIDGKYYTNGPYRKDLAGTTNNSVSMYLNHLAEKIQEATKDKNVKQDEVL